MRYMIDLDLESLLVSPSPEKGVVSSTNVKAASSGNDNNVGPAAIPSPEMLLFGNDDNCFGPAAIPSPETLLFGSTNAEVVVPNGDNDNNVVHEQVADVSARLKNIEDQLANAAAAQVTTTQKCDDLSARLKMVEDDLQKILELMKQLVNEKK